MARTMYNEQERKLIDYLHDRLPLEERAQVEHALYSDEYAREFIELATLISKAGNEVPLPEELSSQSGNAGPDHRPYTTKGWKLRAREMSSTNMTDKPLGVTGSEHDIDQLLKSLTSKNRHQRRSTAIQLNKLARDGSVTSTVLRKAFALALDDKDPVVVANAAHGLAGLGRRAEPTLSRLFGLLQHKTSNVRRAAGYAICAIGPTKARYINQLWEMRLDRKSLASVTLLTEILMRLSDKSDRAAGAISRVIIESMSDRRCVAQGAITLRQLGPLASRMLPELKQMYENETQTSFRALLGIACHAIRADTEIANSLMDLFPSITNRWEQWILAEALADRKDYADILESTHLDMVTHGSPALKFKMSSQLLRNGRHKNTAEVTLFELARQDDWVWIQKAAIRCLLRHGYEFLPDYSLAQAMSTDEMNRPLLLYLVVRNMDLLSNSNYEVIDAIDFLLSVFGSPSDGYIWNEEDQFYAAFALASMKDWSHRFVQELDGISKAKLLSSVALSAVQEVLRMVHDPDANEVNYVLDSKVLGGETSITLTEEDFEANSKRFCTPASDALCAGISSCE